MWSGEGDNVRKRRYVGCVAACLLRRMPGGGSFLRISVEEVVRERLMVVVGATGGSEDGVGVV